MFEEGLIQRHCIGRSFISSLDTMSFFNIKFNSVFYTLAINASDGTINQFYGYKNRAVPEELTELITKANGGVYHREYKVDLIGNFKHTIVDLSVLAGGLNIDYPRKAVVVLDGQVAEADDLPF